MARNEGLTQHSSPYCQTHDHISLRGVEVSLVREEVYLKAVKSETNWRWSVARARCRGFLVGMSVPVKTIRSVVQNAPLS